MDSSDMFSLFFLITNGQQEQNGQTELAAPVTETVTETNSILSSQPELEPEIATTLVPPTTLNFNSRFNPTFKPNVQLPTQTENLQNTEGTLQQQNQSGLNQAQQQDQTLQNNQQTPQQQSQQSLNQGQLLSNNQQNLQGQNQLNENQAQLLVNGQAIPQQQNQQNLNQGQLLPNSQTILQQQSPLSQGQPLINNIPQNTFTLPYNQILQQQWNLGQLTYIPLPVSLTSLQTNIQQNQNIDVTPQTVIVSNNQTDQKQNSKPDVEIVQSVSFSFETPNERKEFVDAVLDGKLFEAPPDKENISLDFINQAVDSFPFRIQQQQQQITTIPQFFTFLLPLTTLPQISIPQYQLSAVQPEPTIQPQQVDITQAPLPKTTTTTETSRRKSRFTPQRKQ